MKKKIAMVFAGLGLCASLVMFNAPEAKAEDSITYIKWRTRICVFGGDWNCGQK